MAPWRTCCGYYCASVAAVGVYFFILMAIMEFRGNTYLVQVLQRASCENPSTVEIGMCCTEKWVDANPDNKNGCSGADAEKLEQPNPSTKGTAFIVFAVIELLLVFGCFYCGKQSAESDEAKKKQENDEYIRAN